MSAGPAPPNPGRPRGSPKAPGPGLIARRGPLMLAGLAVGVTALFYATKKPPVPTGTPTTTLNTTGVQNIEKAYTNAGATSTHTKAYGGTPMGDKNNEELKENMPAGTGAPKGFESHAYGAEQGSSHSTVLDRNLQKSKHRS